MIIGISGKIGTGKSTVAEMLLGSGFVEDWRDFGDEIKEDVSARFGFNLNLCYSEEGKNTEIMHHELPANGIMTVRGILQWWGTDVRREEDPYCWIKKLRTWMLAEHLDSLVIADVRFQEEAKSIRDWNGWLFRILPYPSWKAGSNAQHKSEIDLDDRYDWDRVFQPVYGELSKVAKEITQVVRGK